MRTSCCIYFGREWAKFYYESWRYKRHLLRRVDAYALLDNEMFSQSCTFDVDVDSCRGFPKGGLEVRAFRGGVAEDSTEIFNTINPFFGGSTVLMPLLLIDRSPLIDVDVIRSGYGPIHFVRRLQNEAISAHILTGAVMHDIEMQKRFIEKEFDLEREIFRISWNYVAEVGGKSGGDRINFARELQKLDIYTSSYTDDLVQSLRDQYIQSIPIPVSSSCESVVLIKMKFAKRMTSHPWFSLRAFFEYFGLTAPRFTARCFDSSSGAIAHHLRVASPEGLVLDDLALYDSDGRILGTAKRFADGSGLTQDGVLHVQHARRLGAILDGEKRGDVYFSAKFNPRRGQLLFPVFAISLLVFFLAFLGAFVTSSSVSYSPALHAALLVIPSLSVVFLTGRFEPEYLSSRYAVLRFLFTSASLCAGVSGGLIASIPEVSNVPDVSKVSWGEKYLGPSLLFTLFFSYAAMVLCAFQTARISLLRWVVRGRNVDEVRLVEAVRGSIAKLILVLLVCLMAYFLLLVLYVVYC